MCSRIQGANGSSCFTRIPHYSFFCLYTYELHKLIINKLLYSNNFVLYLYMLNFFMGLCDVFLYLRNEKLEKKDVTR